MKVVSLGFRTDLALLQMGGSEVETHDDHLVVRTPHNPDFWWGNFLLLAHVPTPETSEAWLDRFARAFPSAAHVALGFDVTSGTTADLSWFTEGGFTAEASTVMTASAVHPPARANTSAEYRALASDDDWAQSVELNLRCHDQDEPSSNHRTFVTAKARTNRELVEAGHGQWFGAFVDGRLVAQLGLFEAGQELARFQAVETDPEYRRQGLAGALVYRASRFGLGTLGAHTLVMVADPSYFAIDLYRAVGFAATETQLQVER